MEKKDKKSIFKDLNYGLLLLTIIFAIGGAFLILDASSITSTLRYGLDSPYYFFKWQLIFIFLTFLGSLVILKINTKIYGKLSLSLIIVFLGMLLVQTGLNSSSLETIKEVSLSVKGINFQVSEFLKVFTIMYFGSFYGNILNKEHKTWTFVIPLILVAVTFFVILFGGDFGSAFVYAGICALIFIALPTKKEDKEMNITKLLAVLAIVFAILGLKFAYKVIPEETLKNNYRLARFLYKNPCDRYEEDTGYQVCNGYIAIDNGGLTGLGAGNSIQKYLYLPESHTDFIFPIIIEEFGSLTGIFIILLYMLLITIIFKTATNCYELRNSIICYGIGILFMLHIFVNLGGVLGVIPLTGVPLPFLSYGGSFCLTAIASLAIVQRITIENKREKRKREIKSIVK